MAIFSLRERRSIPELMDAPGLDEASHKEALVGLSRLNRASHAADIIVRPILALAHRHSLKRLTLLDLACGGGDVPLKVAHLARAAGIDLDLTLCDRSPTALHEAAIAAEHANIRAQCIEGDAPDHFPTGPFDIVTNSLFLHHLPAQAVVQTLTAMKSRTHRLLIISDLRRSALGYAIAWVACRTLTRSPIVHYDGPVSVQAAWTLPELAVFAEQAGLHNPTLRKTFPWRMLLTWECPRNEAPNA